MPSIADNIRLWEGKQALRSAYTEMFTRRMAGHVRIVVNGHSIEGTPEEIADLLYRLKPDAPTTTDV